MIIHKEPTAEDLAYSNLLSYSKSMMPSYIISGHHKLMAHYLQKLERGDITRLAIFMPPRMGKTKLASEDFGSWYLGRNPTHEAVFGTYAQDRADDVGKAVRDAMLTKTYEGIFPQASLKSDAKGSRKFQTISGGWYYAVGWGGALTGRGANLLILDDLIKDRADAMSKTNRRKREAWFTSTAYTRLMKDENGIEGRILLIMTRWAYDDIAAYLLNDLAHEKWNIINLPAIAEDKDALGREVGEPLWEEKQDLKRLRTIKQSVPADDWSSLYQQRPLPKEGGLLKFNWFNNYDPHELRFIEDSLKGGNPLPERHQWFQKIVLSLDTAYKPEQINDPSAISAWGYNKNRHYLIESASERLEFPQLKKWVINFHKKYKAWGLGPVPILIEDAASGQSLIQVLRQETNIPIIAIKPDKSKIIRAEHVSDYIESGRVYVPERAKWLTEYQTEIVQFPYGPLDNQVDSTTQYLRWIFKPKKIKRKGKIFFK